MDLIGMASCTVRANRKGFSQMKKTSVSHFSQDPHFQQMLEATSTVKKNVDNPIQSQSLIPAF